MNWKWMRVKKRQDTFQKNVTQDRIKERPVTPRAQIGNKFLFQWMTRGMIAGEEMVMVFIRSTGWTVLAITWVVAMNNMTHWEEPMRPYDIEGGATTVFL